MNMTKKYFASCPRGLEETLFREADSFNFEHIEITRGGLSLKGTTQQILSFLFETRVASRLYKEIGSFQFNREQDIYDSAKEIPWTKILNNDQTLKVNCIISKDAKNCFKNSHHLSLLLKDAIVDTFREKSGKRPNVDIKNPDYSFLLRIEPDPRRGLRGIINVDMVGTPLHARGYRLPGHQAPLKENLAAGLLLNTCWNRDTPLYDLFCGSGTFLIEAAMMAYEICPTYLRLKAFLEGKGVFALENHKWFQKDQDALSLMKELAKNLIVKAENSLSRKSSPFQFRGIDKNPQTLKLLLQSWKKMGLPESALRTAHADALRFSPLEEEKEGIIISNPPYGIRLESKDEKLEELYFQLGENLKKNWKGYHCFIINEDSALRKKISLRTEERFTFWNGPLECRLLHYSLF